MTFRTIALLALWTILSGPVFGPPMGSTRTKDRVAAKTLEKTTSAKKLFSQK